VIETSVTVAASVCAACVVLAIIPPLAPIYEPEPIADVMTYNGMDLFQFADLMGLPATDPYVIALFEELCMTT
jgi:hypothetical protein